MPVPEPGPSETEDDFISRCISTVTREDPERPRNQIIAICFNAWRRQEGMHPDFDRILKLFLTRWGENEGLERFNLFLRNNSLNPELIYDPQVQLREDFQWVKPLIARYRQDPEAKYYLIRCLTSNISMNHNDYSDYTKLSAAAPSLSFRPVNIDHYHSGNWTGDPNSKGGWLPYPRTRIDFTKADDLSVEGTLRVDNRDRLFQQMLDHDPSIPQSEWIYHPSIEGRPDASGMGAGYHFTGMGFLRSGHTLPGDPLTEIIPLMLNESLMESVKGTFDRLEDDTKRNEVKKLAENQVPGQIQKSAKCPQCGHIINDVTRDPEVEDCPRCGTKLEDYDKVKTQSGNKGAEQGGYEPITSEEVMEAPEELFRPPHGDEPDPTVVDPQFSQADLQVANIPTVGPVGQEDWQSTWQEEKATLIAEHNRKVAELTSELIEAQNDNASLNEKIRDRDRKISNLQSTISKAEMDSGVSLEKMTSMKGQVGELAEKVSDLETELKGKEATITELQEQADAKDQRNARLVQEKKELTEDIATLKVKIDEVRRERNELSVQARGSEEKALNETRERSRYQQENAGLRDEIAKLTNELADLSDKVAIKTRKLMEIQNEDIKNKGEIKKLRETLQQANADKKAVMRRIHDLRRIMKEQGLYEIDSKGNIIP